MSDIKTVEAPAVSASQVAIAIGRRESAMHQSIILGQRGTLMDDSLVLASRTDSDLGKVVAAFLGARSALNATLKAQVTEANEAADALVWPFLSRVFGAPMPGVVTLPSDCGMRSIRERVTQLESLHEHAGELSGIVRTTSDDGRSSDTRSFFTRGGRAYFSEHMSL
jgi:hypothetical protein